MGRARSRRLENDAYDIALECGRWVATGRAVDGDTPDALNRAIRADSAREAAR
jgi:hypothetical protein